jgi:hypothetical protein
VLSFRDCHATGVREHPRWSLAPSTDTLEVRSGQVRPDLIVLRSTHNSPRPPSVSRWCFEGRCSSPWSPQTNSRYDAALRFLARSAAHSRAVHSSTSGSPIPIFWRNSIIIFKNKNHGLGVPNNKNTTRIQSRRCRSGIANGTGRCLADSFNGQQHRLLFDPVSATTVQVLRSRGPNLGRAGIDRRSSYRRTARKKRDLR